MSEHMPLDGMSDEEFARFLEDQAYAEADGAAVREAVTRARARQAKGLAREAPLYGSGFVDGYRRAYRNAYEAAVQAFEDGNPGVVMRGVGQSVTVEPGPNFELTQGYIQGYKEGYKAIMEEALDAIFDWVSQD